MLEPEMGSVHPLEAISGTGRRRRFSDEFRARVVKEMLAADAVVSQIASTRSDAAAGVHLAPLQLDGGGVENDERVMR